MVVKHQLYIDLSRRGVVPRIDAVQDDKYTRDVVLYLYAAGTPWEPPSGATVITRYIKRDGVGGAYDTMPDGALAYSISGNVVTVKLAPQVLTVAGLVRMNVGIISGTEEISTFGLQINVHENVAAEVEESEFYQNITGFMPLPATAKVGQYFRTKEVNESGKVTAIEAVDPPDGSGSTDILDVSDLLGYGTVSNPIDLSALDIAANTTVYFSKGTYYVQPLDLDGVENLTIMAQDAQLILTGEYFITGRDCHNFRFLGGLLDGNSNALYGIQLIDSQDSCFADVDFYDFGNAEKENVSMLNLFGDCTGFLVDRCAFDGSTAGVVSSDGFIHAYGIFVNRLGSSKTYSKSGVIRQCPISNIAGTDNGDTKADGDGIFIQAPPYLDDNGNLVIPEAKISIEHCVFDACKKRGIKAAARGVNIEDCLFDGAFWYACTDFQYGHGRIFRSRLTNTSDYNGSITSALVASDGGVDVDDCKFSAPYVYVDPDSGESTNTFHPGIRLGKRLGGSVIGADVAWDPIHINKCRFDGVSRSVFAYNSEGDTTGYTLEGLEITDCEFGEFNQAHVVEINSTMFQKILSYKFVDWRFDYGANRTEVAAVNSKFTYPHASNCEFVRSFELYSRYWENEPMSGYNGLPAADHMRIIYSGSGMGSITYKEYAAHGSLIRGSMAPDAITSTLALQLLYNSRVGDIYVDSTTGDMYRCTTRGTDSTIGVWASIGSGSSSGGVATDTQVESAVAAYMEDNPVQDGQSIYYAPIEIGSMTGVAWRNISDIDTAGRALQIGDLLLTTDGALLKVTALEDATYNASKIVSLSASFQNSEGLSDIAKTLLITILRNGLYSTDQSANITALEKELETNESGDSGGSGDGDGGAAQTETLELIPTESYPDVTTYEYTENTTGSYSTQPYYIARSNEVSGGVLSVEYNTDECNNWNLNLFIFDAQGNPYQHTASGVTWEGDMESPTWKTPGEGSGFGKVTSPFTVEIPDECTCMVNIRRGTGTGSDVTDHDSFKSWVDGGAITITVTK